MNCLKDYIGIRGCGNTIPESGQYINQLPGINMQSFQKIADTEQVTYIKVWDDIQERAWSRIINDLQGRIASKFNIKLNKNYLESNVETGEDTAVSVDNYNGLIVDAEGYYHNDHNKNSFVGIFVESLSLDLIAGKDLTIKIFDKKGKELDSIDVEGTAGSNLIEVNKSYPVAKLFIGTSVEGLMKSTTVGPVADCYDCHFDIYPAQSLTETPRVTAKTNNSVGISATVAIECDYSNIICWNKSLFAHAWMNVLGIEFMVERLYSPRINKLTTVDSTDAEGLRDLYTVDYEKALNTSIKGIRMKADDYCIECRQTVSRRERLP